MFSRDHFLNLSLEERVNNQSISVLSLHHGAWQDGERPLWEKERGGWVCLKLSEQNMTIYSCISLPNNITKMSQHYKDIQIVTDYVTLHEHY